ncbi:MAG: maleylacetoacetate isomerase [Pseudomonadota bacterium]
MSDYTLYNYFRSSTSTRVRVALNLKGIDYRYVPVNLKDGAQHGDYRAVNPEGLVPWLDLGDGHGLSQSLAILEYLDEVEPARPLLPADALGRARARSLALIVACEIHPVNNLRVLLDLKQRFAADSAAVRDWIHHWVHAAFVPLERRLAGEPETGRFCHGDTPTLADICLFAQMFNNRRFEVPMDDYPTVRRIFDACMQVEAFRSAAPDAQTDSE